MKLFKNKNSEDIQKKDSFQEKNDGFINGNKKSLKDLIAPAGIDATNINHLEIIANRNRYARSVVVSTIPRTCTFPQFLRSMYTFGDANISVFIKPVNESTSQTELNRRINELESERIVALDRGDINRERILAQKREETEQLRDSIASGFNRLFESSIICTLFAYNLTELDK